MVWNEIASTGLRTPAPSFCSMTLKSAGVDVVIKFYPWFKFYFPLFWGMVMYGNEFKTKGNII